MCLGRYLGRNANLFAGVFDNANVGSSRCSPGACACAPDKEPGFWGNGSYFGDKDRCPSVWCCSEDGSTVMMVDRTRRHQREVLFEKKSRARLVHRGRAYTTSTSSMSRSATRCTRDGRTPAQGGVGNLHHGPLPVGEVKAGVGDNREHRRRGPYLIKGPACGQRHLQPTKLGSVGTANSIQLAPRRSSFSRPGKGSSLFTTKTLDGE